MSRWGSLWTPICQYEPAPCDRYKHACCTLGDSVYLLGGRAMGVLHDFWRYNIVSNTWTVLDCRSAAAPDELEEHSMVAYQGLLFVFGGMIDSAYAKRKTPLWVYDTDMEQWKTWQTKGADSQCMLPGNRKGHSAVIFESAMYVYGGYVDIIGSSQEFWKLDIDMQAWSALAPAQWKTGPGSRHGHSALVYSGYMYVYGGLMGLCEQSDFWKWEFSSHSWSSIKSQFFSLYKPGPSKLVGHTVVLYKDSMLLFGGAESHTHPRNWLWRFCFISHTWEKLAAPSSAAAPCKVLHCCAGYGSGFNNSCWVEKAQHRSSKSKPFRNKCYTGQVQEDIELETFPLTKVKSQEEQTSIPCLTYENPVTCSKKESIAEHIPVLLVLGGKPHSKNSSISMWKMIIADR